MPVSQIQQIAIGKLRRNPANTRTHFKEQIAQIARGIEKFGFVVPIVADEALTILSGHARHEAARLRSLPTVLSRHTLRSW